MATFGYVAVALGIFFSLIFVGSAQTNDTLDYDFGNYTDGNFTMDDVVSCSELTCQGSGSFCVENNMTAMCDCQDGYRLMSDRRTCEACPGGTYGYGCRNNCSCGAGGNTCNKMNGTCICNPCYSGDTCETDTSFDCFVQFLENPDKSIGTLRESYGTMGYPVVPQIYTRPLLSNLAAIPLIDNGIISSVSIESSSRDEVGQGPLIQFKCTLDKTQGTNAVTSALTTLQNEVKVGNIAGTLIIQDSLTSTTAEVTLNAGIKNNEN